MFKRFLSLFSNSIAIDLGTANTIVYSYGKGIVLNEPSMVAVAVDKNGINKRIVAVGQEAKTMLGKTPGQIEVIRPMKDGVIADFYITEQMIKYFIKKSSKQSIMSFPPTIVICVPCGSTQVERRAIKDSALAAGARHVEIIEEAMAAAIGANLPVESPKASMIIDIGGGTTEVGVISLGGLVYANSIRVAGDRFDEVIINYVRSKHGLLIGDSTAESIKKQIASAHPSADVKESMVIRGRSIYDGLPKQIEITSEELRLALTDPLEQIVVAVKQALELTPPELSADLMESGFVLTGGGALLRGLNTLLEDISKLKVTIADEPLLCVAKGCGMSLEHLTNSKIYFNRIR
ncbi:MAG: rod shape-determining protein [Burkholderiales bacterium]|nr:rod shape-determining protein [Burkholderiales bacterium]